MLDILLPLKFQIEQMMKRKCRFKCSTKRILKITFIVVLPIPIVMYMIGLCTGNSLGDYVTALITFIGILLTAWTFMEQFDFNRKSFKEQSRSNREMFEEQNKLNRKSEATNNFFKMTDSHNTMLGQMSIEDENGKVIQGGLVFDVIHCQFLRIMNSIVIPARNKIYGKISHWYPFGLLEFCDDIAYAILYYGVDNGDIDDNDDNDDNNDNSTIPLVYKEWYYHALRNTEFEDNRKEEMLEECAFVLNKYRRKYKGACDFMCRSNRSLLIPYFRNVYNILSFVANNGDIIDDDEEILIRNFRSQLFYSKSLIWHYHLHVKIGESEWNEDLNPYVEKYGLLDGLKFRAICKD